MSSFIRFSLCCKSVQHKHDPCYVIAKVYDTIKNLMEFPPSVFLLQWETQLHWWLKWFSPHTREHILLNCFSHNLSATGYTLCLMCHFTELAVTAGRFSWQNAPMLERQIVLLKLYNGEQTNLEDFPHNLCISSSSNCSLLSCL